VNEQEIIETENRLMANVFAKKPLVLNKGKGAIVWTLTAKNTWISPVATASPCWVIPPENSRSSLQTG